jgi:hypothetical protein
MTDGTDDALSARLRRLGRTTPIPAPDSTREAALLAAFDRAVRTRSRTAATAWSGGAMLAAAAAVLIAVGIAPMRPGRHGRSSVGRPPESADLTRGRDVQGASPGPFVIVPGAGMLPALENGTLVRMDIPVALLPSLGVTPPSTHALSVTADLIVGQDGMTRAVRLVN